ncbi:MAG: lactose/cellobiose PTS transporter subunit IIB [Atopobiaceae bacterium]|nr:lactose/cellobiose PTS transporter subunit IIB [Atopobiaceae bacterium]
MDKLIAQIEKGKPFFDKLARNKYLKSIRDGFMSAMPIIIFSSIFLLVADVPAIWGFTWPDDIQTMLMKPYNYSMGILSLVVTASTAKHFTDALNRDMPINNQINFISTMIAAIVGFLILSSDAISIAVSDTVTVSGFDSSYLGSKGLLTAFIAAFVVGWFYKLFVGHNITIKMPKEVPPNISQAFKDIIPFSAAILFFWLFDHFFRMAFGYCFAQGVIQVFQPIFTAADGYLGLAIIYGAMSLFWFVGVHGPSIVEPAIEVALLSGMTDNLAAVQAGVHATHALSLASQYFVVCLGGTGATLVVCLMFAFLAKSKEMKAIGRASAIPVLFNVNEPFLFGAPMILNPVFFIPFIFTPILNIWLFKFFIDFLGMNGLIYTLPWTTPGPLGIILSSGLAPMAIVFTVCVLALDFVCYFPFFKVYDKQMCDAEAENLNEEAIAEKAAKMNDAFQGKTSAEAVAAVAAPAGGTAAVAAPAATGDFADLAGKKVLVLCAGGGTSGLLANALAKAAKERDLDLETAAGSYGAHLDIMPNFDLVVLAPQVASYYEDLKKDAARMDVATVACEGKQYIDLTRDGEAALRFVSDTLKAQE